MSCWFLVMLISQLLLVNNPALGLEHVAFLATLQAFAVVRHPMRVDRGEPVTKLVLKAWVSHGMMSSPRVTWASLVVMGFSSGIWNSSYLSIHGSS